MKRRTKDNQRANRELQRIMADTPYCEANVSPDCKNNWWLSFHHHPKKSTGFYVKQPEKLYDKKHVLILCINCHDLLHKNKQLNEDTFNRLRGDIDNQ